MKLNHRLRSVASFVPYGETVADIGTDHAYLPIYLVLNSIAPKVIAVEFNPGPLEKAKQNIIKYQLCDKIEVRNGYGFEPISSEEVETAVIAGIGGTSIIDIIESSQSTARSLNSLILQPMNKVELVRAYLRDNNFELKDEELILEDNRYYEILSAASGPSVEYDELFFEIGPILLKKNHPLLAEYLEEKISHYWQVINSLERSSNVGAQEKKEYLKSKIRYLEKVVYHVNKMRSSN